MPRFSFCGPVLDDQCGPFWEAYQFRCPVKEELYRKRYAFTAAMACRIWCVAHVMFSLAMPLGHIRRTFDMSFYLSYAPITCIALVALGLLTFVPRALHYVPLIASIAVMSMVVASACVAHVQYTAWTAWGFDNDLNSIVSGLTPHDAVVLSDHLDTRNLAAVGNAYLGYQVPQLLLMAFIGLYRSTALVTMLVPFVYWGIIALSTKLALVDVFFRIVTVCIYICFLLALMATLTLNRREAFSLAQAVETSLKEVMGLKPDHACPYPCPLSDAVPTMDSHRLYSLGVSDGYLIRVEWCQQARSHLGLGGI